MEPRPIHDDQELKAAVLEMRRLWGSRDPADVRRLADWGILVDLYEAAQIEPASGADPVDVILAEMEMSGRTRADLAELVGSNRATEILRRRRPLTLSMIRRLHEAWKIPAELLITQYETAA